jgi:hypothetical protein
MVLAQDQTPNYGKGSSSWPVVVDIPSPHLTVMQIQLKNFIIMSDSVLVAK